MYPCALLEQLTVPPPRRVRHIIMFKGRDNIIRAAATIIIIIIIILSAVPPVPFVFLTRFTRRNRYALVHNNMI